MGDNVALCISASLCGMAIAEGLNFYQGCLLIKTERDFKYHLLQIIPYTCGIMYPYIP